MTRELSKYAAKLKKREEEIYEEIYEETPTKEETPIIQQVYDFKNGFITTENGIRTGITFLPNPKAISVIPYKKEKTIQSLLFRENKKTGTFSIAKQQEKYSTQPKDIFTSENFEDLYTKVSWLIPQGLNELQSIKEVLELRRKDIEKYTGLELNLD